MQRAAQICMSGNLAASALIKRQALVIKRSLGLALIKRSLGRLLLKMAWGAPRARTLNLCPKRLTAILFPIKLGCSTKSTCAGSWRKDDDQAQISKPPPLGACSAIRSRERRPRKLKLFSNMARRATLARPSTRAGSTDDRAQFSQPPPSYGSLRNPITGVPVRGN